MASTWSDFDNPFTISLLSTPKATTNQSTGALTIGSTTTTTILGSLDEDPLSDEDRQPGGLIRSGDAIFYSETVIDLAKDNVVRVHLDSSGTNYRDFRVAGVERDYAWLHGKESTTKRSGYILRRVNPE